MVKQSNNVRLRCQTEQSMYEHTIFLFLSVGRYMKMEQQFRNPTAMETELMQRLLAAEFVGKEEIAKQLENARVRVIDEEGSLEFQPSSVADTARVNKRIPVEAEGVDEDGIHVHFLLHVVKGFVKELEVYKDDGSPIKGIPSPGDLEVIVLPA